ncbi:MAG TPA: sugar ABC transporter permease [Candidatus Avipropionibacterium avicola]|uniref:Sugar ABC transporter permease n=1 Tax=Candidatus Avipropionibacterium avicola TaxID=2840701 RepID=A0A9D1GVM9_9ACTN|nr:sugar ABC transporter permease [Candidatus Avipropionibacterium avicola]
MHSVRTAAPRLGVWGRVRRDASLLVMVVPTCVLLVLFVYAPLVGNVVAFMDYIPYLRWSETTWVGLQNFHTLFSDPDFWRALVNTLQITALQLLFSFPVPILLALLLHSVLSPYIRGFVQSVIYLPHFLSWVIVVAIFERMLGGTGLTADVVQSLGGGPINIMGIPETFKLLVVGQGVWKDAGWGTIIFLAALSNIDHSLYESAAVDGASAWRRTWHITLPGVRPIIVLLLIMQLGTSLSVGFEQLLLQRDNVGPAAAEVLDTYVYFRGVVNGDWSIGVAAGLLKGVVGLALILAANKAAHLLGEAGVYSRDA